MADEAKDILEKSFGKEQPLTEPQKQIKRNAAAFAVATFSNTFRKPENLKKLNVSLTDEQIRFAENLANVFPKPEDVLPKSEFNSADSGFFHLSSTPIREIIPALLVNENEPFSGDYETATKLFQEDPSGISYLEHILNQIQDKARHGKNVNLKEKEDEFKRKMVEMLDDSQMYSEEIPPGKPLDDQSMQEIMVKSILKAFSINKRNPKESFLIKKRQSIHEEIPLEFTEDGKILPTDGLVVTGARLAFEHYQTAVNTYLNRWGK